MTQATTIAKALFDIFLCIGPPTILQPDNGREFSGIAAKSITEEDVVEVIPIAFLFAVFSIVSAGKM